MCVSVRSGARVRARCTFRAWLLTSTRMRVSSSDLLRCAFAREHVQCLGTRVCSYLGPCTTLCSIRFRWLAIAQHSTHGKLSVSHHRPRPPRPRCDWRMAEWRCGCEELARGGDCHDVGAVVEHLKRQGAVILALLALVVSQADELPAHRHHTVIELELVLECKSGWRAPCSPRHHTVLE